MQSSIFDPIWNCGIYAQMAVASILRGYPPKPAKLHATHAIRTMAHSPSIDMVAIA